MDEKIIGLATPEVVNQYVDISGRRVGFVPDEILSLVPLEVKERYKNNIDQMLLKLGEKGRVPSQDFINIASIEGQINYFKELVKSKGKDFAKQYLTLANPEVQQKMFTQILEQKNK